MQIGEMPQDIMERLVTDNLESAVRGEIERRTQQILENSRQWRLASWRSVRPRFWKRVACWILGNHLFEAADWSREHGTKHRCSWCGKTRWVGRKDHFS